MTTGDPITVMTIGEFARRSRLSPKALRLYDQLGLLVPARTDAVSGYRLYTDDQLPRAELVALLRRLDMPLPEIALLVDADPQAAATRLRTYWNQVEATTTERRGLVAYLEARLTGADMPDYTVETRTVGARAVASVTRHVHTGEADGFFAVAFPRLHGIGAGLPGIEGAPYVVYYGEVSDDSDGPVALCRPVTSDTAAPGGDIELRTEPLHEEAYIRLSKAQLDWPALLPAVAALEGWARDRGRQPAGPVRQVLIADLRTAGPDEPVCDLTLPVA